MYITHKNPSIISGVKMARSPSRRGIDYEKQKSTEHGARHVGGPGKHDYERGTTRGEVKCRDSPVTKPELQRLIKQKGINEVDSKGGFTEPAVEYRDRYRPEVKLFKRGKKI